MDAGAALTLGQGGDRSGVTWRRLLLPLPSPYVKALDGVLRSEVHEGV